MSKLKFKSKILSRAHILNQYAKYTTKMSAGLFFLFFKDIFIRYKVDRSFSFSTSKMLLHCFLAPLFKIMRVHTVVPCMWCVISFWLLSSLSLQFGFHQFGYDVPRHNPPPLQKTELIQVPVFFTNTFPYSCFLFIWPFEDMKVFSVPWHTAVVPSSSSPTPYYIYLHFPPKLPSGRKRKNAFQGLKIPRPFCQECDQQNLFKLCTCLTSVCSIIY